MIPCRRNRTPGKAAAGGRGAWLPALFVLLLAARALVPPGYMVAVGAQGDPSLALCSGLAAAPGSSHNEHHHDDGSRTGRQDAGHDPCPFALAGGAALAQASPLLSIAAIPHEPPNFPTHSASVLRRFTGAHGARAPPALSC